MGFQGPWFGLRLSGLARNSLIASVPHPFALFWRKGGNRESGGSMGLQAHE